MAQFDPSKAIAYSPDFQNSGDVFMDDSLSEEDKKQALALLNRQPVGKPKFNPASATPYAEAAPATVEAPLTLKSFTEARQRSATQEPAFQKLAGSVIPTLAGAASLVIPGAGLGALAAQSALSAGATGLNQALGFEPYSPTQIGIAAAVPPAAIGALKGVKGAYKAAGKFFAPGATRTAGVEAAVERAGAVPNAIDRAYAPRASNAAFAGVRATAEEVPTNVLNRAVTSAFNDLPRANRPEKAAEYLTNLSKTLDAEGSLPYADIHKQIRGMYGRAKDLIAQGEGEAGQALLGARAKIIDELDKVSPALKEANMIFRREQATEQIAKVLSNPRPDVKLGELLLKDPAVKGAFSYTEAKYLENIAKQITTMGTQASPYSGVTARFLNLVSTPVAAAMASKPGMYLMRQTFKDGKVTAAGLATLAQFGRAYLAQEQQPE